MSTDENEPTMHLGIWVPQPSNPDGIVRRYLTLPKLISLFETQSLYLRRLDKLQDEFEGSLTLGESQAIKRMFERAGCPLKFQESIRLRKDSRSKTYVNGWHMKETESYALWREYAGDGDGVAIETNYSRLAASVPNPDYQVGMVEYIDYSSEDYLGAITPYKLAYRKPDWLDHEREARIMCRCLEEPMFQSLPGVSIERPAGNWVPWDLGVIERLIIHPDCDDVGIAAIRSIVNRYCPSLDARIELSRLRRAVLY